VLPDAGASINLDDLRYAPMLGRVLAPAGDTLFLVDPKDQQVTRISGLAVPPDAGYGALDAGTTPVGRPGTSSVEEGPGVLYAAVRRDHLLYTMTSTGGSIRTSTLAGAPDYVRRAPSGEVWLTEPLQEQIEILAPRGDRLRHAAFISTPGGPEGLVFDAMRSRAYAHAGPSQSQTIALDPAARSIVATWTNGCATAKGIALDEARGQLFVACDEGKVFVLDVAHDGKQLSMSPADTSLDLIDYDPNLHHLYVPSAHASKISIFGVSASGQLALLGKLDTASDAHCVVADRMGNAYVCDGMGARLLVFADPFAPTP
jgi:hypothetical protein